MNTDARIAALKRWQDAMELADEHFIDLQNLIGLDPEGATMTAVCALQGALTAATADLVGDCYQWLEWYWLENAMGEKGAKAGPNDDLRPIQTPDDLAWLIEMEEKQEA